MKLGQSVVCHETYVGARFGCSSKLLLFANGVFVTFGSFHCDTPTTTVTWSKLELGRWNLAIPPHFPRWFQKWQPFRCRTKMKGRYHKSFCKIKNRQNPCLSWSCVKVSIIFDIYALFYLYDEPIVNFGWYRKKVPFDALMIDTPLRGVNHVTWSKLELGRWNLAIPPHFSRWFQKWQPLSCRTKIKDFSTTVGIWMVQIAIRPWRL